MDYFFTIFSNCTIIIAGDCNQLHDNIFTELGLLLQSNVATHRGHNLDKIFVSKPLYSNVKAVRSSIKTEHASLVARADSVSIIDSNKIKNKLFFCKPTPARNASFLSGTQTFDWSPVLETDNTLTAFDNFYSSAHYLLDTFSLKLLPLLLVEIHLTSPLSLNAY